LNAVFLVSALVVLCSAAVAVRLLIAKRGRSGVSQQFGRTPSPSSMAKLT
jgi:hypothetical protein